MITERSQSIRDFDRSALMLRLFRSPSRALAEMVTYALLFLAASISILTTLGIVTVLSVEMIYFFQKISIFEFLFGTQWTPLIEPRRFGILPLMSGTLMIGIGASLIAVPIGVMAALFLSEYVHGVLRSLLKSTLEILAGIPSVVYGFLAVTFITPHLQAVIPELQVFNALSAAIVVGVMIIPTIASISEDAFQAVPKELRLAAYGLGARKHQVATKIVFPAALSGVVASVILGFSRAIGETMAVTLAAGATPKLTLNPLESIQTMTAYIVQVSLGDTPAGTVEYHSIFAVGLVLFLLTVAANIVARFVVKHFQETYS